MLTIGTAPRRVAPHALLGVERVVRRCDLTLFQFRSYQVGQGSVGLFSFSALFEVLKSSSLEVSRSRSRGAHWKKATTLLISTPPTRTYTKRSPLRCTPRFQTTRTRRPRSPTSAPDSALWSKSPSPAKRILSKPARSRLIRARGKKTNTTMDATLDALLGSGDFDAIAKVTPRAPSLAPRALV